jgi:hypothetical protein
MNVAANLKNSMRPSAAMAWRYTKATGRRGLPGGIS